MQQAQIKSVIFLITCHFDKAGSILDMASIKYIIHSSFSKAALLIVMQGEKQRSDSAIKNS